jgi:transcriptional regulator with XRE-family HTH domain
MENFINKNKQTQNYISDFAVLIKKMRLMRKMKRQQAAQFLPFQFKHIEKLENGRAEMSLEHFKLFQTTYGFSDAEVEEMRSGKFKCEGQEDRPLVTTVTRRDRRFCHRKITRECKVLKEMRLQRDIDQFTASINCQIGRNSIGFIENGRVSLTEKKIRHIVETYGFTMEYFYQLLKQPLLRHEIIEQCQLILEKLDENKLRVIQPMLQAMSNN